MDFCFFRDTNTRINTHYDNRIMQHIIAFYKANSSGIIFSIMIDADDLIDTLSVSAVLDKIKTTEQLRLVSIMMPPTVESFIKEMGA